MGKVIVIGGGASGLIASGRAAENGHQVHLYEKNNKLGKKLYITGKGRCNLTNASDIETIIDNIVGNPYFMYSSLYTFDNKMTVKFFEDLGVKTKVERGNRVFPVSDKSSDVISALERYAIKNNVKIHLESCVKDIIIENNKVKGIRLLNDSEIFADAIIIATGGLSYPKTGSTGDGYRFAKFMGHNVTKLYPSLVPLKVKEKFCKNLMGLSLKNVSIIIKNNENKTIYRDFGEMLFTHYGISGPIILSASRHLLGNLNNENYIVIDLKPALDEKTLNERILRDFNKYINKDFKNSLNDLLPQKIIPIIIELSGISPEKKVNSIKKDERKLLCQLIKNFKLTITDVVGYNEAVITSGGIDVNEINPSTMESKLIKNIYFVGEVLDVDAYTGGYNLQIAFSTGYCAGKYVLEE